MLSPHMQGAGLAVATFMVPTGDFVRGIVCRNADAAHRAVGTPLRDIVDRAGRRAQWSGFIRCRVRSLLGPCDASGVGFLLLSGFRRGLVDVN